MYAIKKNEPNNIYYYIEERSDDKYYKCDDINKSTRRINHNCLVNNENIICAGEMHRDSTDMLTIDNSSGHYQPADEALDYVLCLLDTLDIKYYQPTVR